MTSSEVTKTASRIDVGNVVTLHYTLDAPGQPWAGQTGRFRGRVVSIEETPRLFWIRFDGGQYIVRDANDDGRWTFSGSSKNVVSHLEL